MHRTVKNPIFIVGAPRSGTGIFYRTMANHPDLAWISNITKKFPSSLFLTRIIMLFRDDHRPTEANNVWQKFTSGKDESLGRDDVTPAVRQFFHRIVRINLRLFNKPRFLNKCPGNSVRVEFLKEIFPDARFIHLIRDGRAASYSIMRSRLKHSGAYWSVKPPGWQDLMQRPLVEACALQWKMVVEHAMHLIRTRYIVKRGNIAQYPSTTKIAGHTQVIALPCGPSITCPYDITRLNEHPANCVNLLPEIRRAYKRADFGVCHAP